MNLNDIKARQDTRYENVKGNGHSLSMKHNNGAIFTGFCVSFQVNEDGMIFTRL